MHTRPVLFVLMLMIAATAMLVPFQEVTGEEHTVMTREEFDRWPELPEYTIFNFFPAKGNNCTWYAHGRMMQLGYCKYALDSMRFNARNWADDAGRGAEVHDTPQVASIAFWEGGAFFGSVLGHVGVVEAIYEDGSILISDSSSSAAPYNTFVSYPGDKRWPTAFIIVPEAKTPSDKFIPGDLVQTTVSNLNFRLTGVNQTPILINKGTALTITGHVTNGIYASPPGTFTHYHYWWHAELECDGDVLHGWVAETYLEMADDDHRSDVEEEEPERDPGADSDQDDDVPTDPDHETDEKGDDSGTDGDSGSDYEGDDEPESDHEIEPDPGEEDGHEHDHEDTSDHDHDSDHEYDSDNEYDDEDDRDDNTDDGDNHEGDPANPDAESEDDEQDTGFMLGDVNGDSAVNVLDVHLVMRYILETGELDESGLQAADVNGDGKIDLFDVVLLMRYSLGLIASFD